MKQSRSGFASVILIFIILAVAIVGAAYNYTRPKINNSQLQKYAITKPGIPIDTDHWNTYKNLKYGFEFKYPNSLSDTCCGVYSDDLIEMQKVVTLAEKLDTDFEGGAEVYNGISIHATSSKTSLDLEAFVTDQKIKILEHFYKDQETLAKNEPQVRIEKSSVNSIESYRIPNLSVLNTNVYYLKSNDGTILALMESEEHTPEFEKVFDTILSTFQFSN
jgi:hypothetical protein